MALAASLACSSDDDPEGSGGTAGTAGSGASAGTAGTGGSAGSGGSGGTAGSGGTEGGAPQGTRFVPEGVTAEYVGAGPSGGLELIAFTLLEAYGSLGDPAFFVAVKNNGADPICGVDVPSEFFDAQGTKLASSVGAGALSAPVYESFGSFSPCLGTGDIGMGLITLGLGSLDVSQVKRIEHGFVGNIDPDATKVTNVLIQNVQIEQSSPTSARASGVIANNGTGAIEDPDVAIYAVDPAGRPYGVMTDIERTTIAAGGTWTFQTLSYSGQVQGHAAYVDFDKP